MANWIGVARTNYFLVEDLEAFETEMRTGFPGVRVVVNDGRVALFGEEGYWPTERSTVDDDGEEDAVDIDFVDVVASHLADGEAAVFQTAGFEKERYVTGHAIAVNSEGGVLEVSLDEIYNMIWDSWKLKPGPCAY